MTTIKNMEKEIQRYYKLSLFVNKYISFITAIVLSFLFILSTSSNSVNISAYSNDIIAKKDITIPSDVIKLDNFNSKSEDIQAKIILLNNKKTDKWIYIWYGVFIDKKGNYIPNDVIMNNEDLKSYLKKATTKEYISLLKKIKKVWTKFVVKKSHKLSDDDVIKKYNLECIDSILSTTTFCELNKRELISDIIKNNIDISQAMYSKLFSNLQIDDKCSLLENIFFARYNYSSIKTLVANYCDVNFNAKNRIETANELVKFFPDNNIFSLNQKIGNTFAYRTQLVNQIYYIVNRKRLPNDKILSHLKLVELGIKNNLLNTKLADIEYYILTNYILKSTNSSDIKNAVSTLINWNTDTWFKWLKSMLPKNKVVTKKDTFAVYTDKKIISSREAINNIMVSNYKNKFILTKKVKTIQNNKFVEVEWKLLLNYATNWQVKEYEVPLKFLAYNLDWINFKVKNIVIMDKKVKDYLSSNISDSYDSFDELYNDLKSKLYVPVIEWSWDRTIKKITICEKFNKAYHNWWCKNWKVTISESDLWFQWYAKIQVYLNKELKVEKIDVVDNVTIELNNFLKEEISLNKLLLNKKFNILLKKLKTPKYNYILSLIKKTISTYKDKKIKIMVWLTSTWVSKIESNYKRYLWVNIEAIRKKWKFYYVYFELKWNLYLAIYSYKTNYILSLAILDKNNIDKKILFKWFKLKLSNNNLENLNSFKLDPIWVLRSKYPNEIKKYEKEFLNK